MTYPNYPTQPGAGYLPPPPQPGYQQPYPQQGYGPPAPPQQYPPQPGYSQPAPQGPPVDWAAMYDTADMSGGPRGMMDVGTYPVVITEAEWTISKNGNGMWRVQGQVTAGQYAGWKRTVNLVVKPTRDDGSENKTGMGMLFRRLEALGIPKPPDAPTLYPPPNTPLATWEPFMARIAQMMLNRACQFRIKHRAADGDYPERDDVDDIEPPAQGQQAGPPQGYPQGVQQPAPSYAQPPGPAHYNPVQPQFPGQPSGQVAPGPWQQAQQPQGPPASPPAPGQQYAGAPGAQPPSASTPPSGPPGPSWAGQPGTGQFTPEGQARQGNGQQAAAAVPQGPPGPSQPPWAAGQ